MNEENKIMQILIIKYFRNPAFDDYKKIILLKGCINYHRRGKFPGKFEKYNIKKK